MTMRIRSHSLDGSSLGPELQGGPPLTRRVAMQVHDPMSDDIAAILQRYKSLAVVGLSSKRSRPSHGVAKYMKANGYSVIPVNPHEHSVLDEKVYASLEEVPGPLEVVVIFRRPEFVPEIVEAAIRKKAKVIWMQEGITNEGAARRAQQAGLQVVQDRCILKEHARRFVTEGL